jgi:hypothetical protein
MEIVAALSIGFLIGAAVMFVMANRAIDSAFEEWERDHPGEGFPT